MLPWTNLADDPSVRCRYHHASVVPVDRLLHDAELLVGLVVPPDGQHIDRHVESGLEGDHLGPHALQIEGQVPGGRAQLEHPLARDVHTAEVGGLVTPQVPRTRQHPPVGQFEGVAPDEPVEAGALRPPFRLGGLEGRVEWPRYPLGG